MNSILFACDGHHFPKGALEFVSKLTTSSRLEGYIFMPLNYKELVMPPKEGDPDPTGDLLKKARSRFVRECTSRRLNFNLHTERDGMERFDLLKESRFNDFMVLSAQYFYSELDPKEPNPYMETLLHSAECPALVIPEEFQAVRRLVFAYDGKEACMYALRQFSYLLPEYRNLPMEVVHIDSHGKSHPDIEFLEGFLKTRSYRVHLFAEPFESNDAFLEWVDQVPDALLITGSFGRSSAHYVFRNSFSRGLIRKHRTPVFIAHGM